MHFLVSIFSDTFHTVSFVTDLSNSNSSSDWHSYGSICCPVWGMAVCAGHHEAREIAQGLGHLPGVHCDAYTHSVCHGSGLATCTMHR